MKTNVIGAWLMVLALAFTTWSCEKENDDDDSNDNNNNQQEEPTGDLEVFIRKDSPSGVYLGGALVNLYESQEDMDNDSIHTYNYTSTNTGSTTNSALFEGLPVQEFFIKVSANVQGTPYEGTESVNVIKDYKQSIHITAKPK